MHSNNGAPFILNADSYMGECWYASQEIFVCIYIARYFTQPKAGQNIGGQNMQNIATGPGFSTGSPTGMVQGFATLAQ
jgi:hypothetical protein